MALTPERIGRIQDCLRETRRHLAKALAYSPDLQDAERIKDYQEHIAYLESLLN